MPYYRVIKDFPARDRGYAIPRLQALRAALAASIPRRTATETILIATWNIREFDSRRYGGRSEMALLMIAEIASRFDLIAVQEVRDNLYGLQRLTRHLGPWWDYLVTDVTLGRSGNSERLAYVFDKRKVSFSGLAAEVVLPPGPQVRQLARSPYVAGFKCGWSQINLCTVHIYYGTARRDDPRRVQEIADLSRLLARHASQFTSGRVRTPAGDEAFDENLLLLGDFNVFKRTDATFTALTDAGFVLPEGLFKAEGSNADMSKYYDQIVYLERLTSLHQTGKAGVFDFFEHVYRDADEDVFAADVAATSSPRYRDWRTYQMSDHLPMWAEFRIDDADAYLDHLASG